MIHLTPCLGFPGGSEVKASACNEGDLDSIPGSGRSPGEGNGNPLQYSCLENPMDVGAWWATVHGVAKSWTRLSDFTFTFYITIQIYFYITVSIPSSESNKEVQLACIPQEMPLSLDSYQILDQKFAPLSPTMICVYAHHLAFFSSHEI